MKNYFTIEDKVIVVTGASRGLGKYMAQGLAACGAKIVAAATSAELLGELKAEIEQAGGSCAIFPTDISQEENVQALTEREYGRADVLINNAGINRRGLLTELSKEDWEATLAVNLTGSFLCLQHFSRLMQRQKQGKIINIASVMATAVTPRAGAYCASKGGVQQLTKAAAVELAADNIQVNAIAPGYFMTEINAPYLKDPEKSAAIAGKAPLGRWGGKDDLVGVAIFLASAASDFVTGHVLYVDGGYLCL